MIKRTETDGQTDGEQQLSEVVSVSVQTREEMFVFLRFVLLYFSLYVTTLLVGRPSLNVRTLIASSSSSIR